MPPLAAAARFNQSPLKNARSPKSEPTFQPLMFFCPVARYCSTLSSPCFMPSNTAALRSRERSFVSNVLPGADANACQLRPNCHLFRSCGGKLQRKVEVGEEVLLNQLSVRLWEVDCGCRGRRRLFEK